MENLWWHDQQPDVIKDFFMFYIQYFLLLCLAVILEILVPAGPSRSQPFCWSHWSQQNLCGSVRSDPIGCWLEGADEGLRDGHICGLWRRDKWWTMTRINKSESLVIVFVLFVLGSFHFHLTTNSILNKGLYLSPRNPQPHIMKP